MRSLSTTYLDSLVFSGAQISTLRTLGEYRGKQELYTRQRPETLEALRTVATIESTDASNRLEGITVPDARLRALVKHSTKPRNRSEQEIAGYRDALDLIHQSRADIPVSVNVIRQLHQTIQRYGPEPGGAWKSVDNEIVERDSDGKLVRVRFHAVPAVSTPQGMDDLVAEYEETQRAAREPLLVVPLVVLDFLCIHPFRDGNGRVARLLTLLLLYHAGYEVGRYISLERLFQKSGETYYDALEASSISWHEGEHNVTPWIEYFWGVLLRAYREFEQRVGNLDVKQGSKSERVREAVGRHVGSFRVVDLERECPDVSRETIRLVLKKLKAEGAVAAIGRGPGARWRKVGAAR